MTAHISPIFEAGVIAGRAAYRRDIATAAETRRRYRHRDRIAFDSGYATGFRAQETPQEKWDRERPAAWVGARRETETGE